jgi:hypothetical protein
MLGDDMALRTSVALAAGLAFVVGLVNHLLPLAIAGLLAMLGALVVRPGSNPLAETYRDVREPLPVDPKRDW